MSNCTNHYYIYIINEPPKRLSGTPNTPPHQPTWTSTRDTYMFKINITITINIK